MGESLVGIFKLEETEPKPFKLKTTMNSRIECKNLHELAKMLLWVDENIPTDERSVSIQDYYDGTWVINVSWTEYRG